MSGSVGSQRLPVLIFDFGNVVAFFDYKRAWERLGPLVGMSAEAFAERVRGSGVAELARSHETGRIGGEEFWRGFAGRVGMEAGLYELFRLIYGDIFWLNQPVVELLGDLKGKGYLILVGSNTCDLHAEQYRVRYVRELAPVSGYVLSYEVGVMKPSGEFYEACRVAAGGVAARECVFIDDAQANVDGACASGMLGILYEGPAKLLADLAAVGVGV